MNVILSIRPNFCNMIFSGQKKYEYRKRIFTRMDVDKVYVYATKPICKIVGCFRVEEVIEDKVGYMWKKTHISSGISKEYFDAYFLNAKTAYAIKIKDARQYPVPIDPKKIIKGFHAPQNFIYVDFDL